MKSPKALQRSKDKARQQEALIRQQYFREKQETAENSSDQSEITFGDWAKRFLELAAQEYQQKPNTVGFFSDRVKALLRFKPLKETLLSKMYPELIDDYRLWRSATTKVIGLRKSKGNKAETTDTFRPVSVATINRDLATLRLMLNKAREQEKYRVAALRIRLNLKAEKKRERIITHVEEEAYLAATGSELLKDFVTIAVETGMRPDSEISAMQWQYVDFPRGIIFVPDGKTDNARREIPMSKRARNVLRRLHFNAGKPEQGYVFARDKEPVPYSAIDTLHDRTIKNLALEDENRIRLYDFRHTALTRMNLAGMDPFTLMKIAGHASIKTTERYVKVPGDHMRRAVNQLDQYNDKARKAVAAKLRAKVAKQAS